MNLIERLKEHFKLYDAYKWALLLAAILAFGALLPLFILYFLHTGSLSAIEYFWMPFAGASLLLSGSGYVGKAVGFVKNMGQALFHLFSHGNAGEHTKSLNCENMGVTFGVALGGLLAGLTLGVFGDHSLFPLIFQDHSLFASIGGCIFSSISFFSVYGGVTNRFGRGVADRELNKNKVDTNYAFGIRGGLIIGIGLVVGVLIFCHPAMLVYPLILTSFAVIGMCASISGYIGRVFDHLLGSGTHIIDVITNKAKRDKVFNLENFWNRTSAERIGTSAGMIIGIICGSFLVAKGLLLMPFFGVGTPVALLGLLIIATCANIGAGLGNRLGCLFDKPRDPNEVELDMRIEPEYCPDPENKEPLIPSQSPTVVTQALQQAATLPKLEPVAQIKAAVEKSPEKKRARSQSFTFRDSKVGTTFVSPVPREYNSVINLRAPRENDEIQSAVLNSSG